MKTVLLTAVIALAFAQASHAMIRPGGDQEYVTIMCQPAEVRPDLGMSVTVSEGGIAGLAKITVSRFFLGHSTEQTYYTKRTQSKMIGAPVAFIGQGVRLTVNFTTSPRQDDGGFYSTLQIKENGATSLEKLSCQPIYHTM